MKRFLSLFLSVLIVITFSPTVFAVDLGSEIDAGYILESGVEQDLADLYIDGKRFSEADYPLNNSVNYITLLSFLEFGYHPESDENLYYVAYVYNPSGAIVLGTGNKIQLGINDPNISGGYTRYSLQLLDASDDYRFLKFGFSFLRSDELNPSSREYSVSGIELNTKANGIIDHKIATEFVFSGSQYDGTLTCQTDGLVTIDIDLYSTYYRLNSSDKGAGYYSQLDSVYFALDDWLMDEYGEVYSIQGQYAEQLFNTMVLLGDYPEVLNAITQSGTPLNEYYGCDTNIACSHWRGSDGKGGYLWTCGYGSDITFLMSIFQRESSGNTVPVISSEEKLAFADRYDMWTKAEVFYFDDIEKNWRWRPRYKSFDITIEDSFELLSFNENHNWLQVLLNYGLFSGVFGEDSIETEAIVKIPSSSSGLSSSDFSSLYFVNENDVDEIKNFVADSDSKGQTVYLFHFDTQDFFSTNMYFTEGPASDSVLGYYTEEIAYHNFDVMSITFRDDADRYMILPVISDPTDVLSDSEPPVNIDIDFPKIFGGDGTASKILSYVLIALVVILTVWLLFKLIPKRVKVVNRSGRRRRR